MNVSLIYKPGSSELELVKAAMRVTMHKDSKGEISSETLHKLLEARHSPIRVLNFAFRFESIPSNTATHLCRHVHAVPFVSSLRNDRQDVMDGDAARRDTPVDMILYVNAEELMVIANKRLCMKAAAKTREAVKRICELAEDAMPELHGLLVPMCEYCGGVCHEVQPCGR